MQDQELSLEQMIRDLVFKEGWERKLKVDLLSPGTVVQVRAKIPAPEYSEQDIVGNYSVADYRSGDLTRESVRYDCRSFLRERNAL